MVWRATLAIQRRGWHARSARRYRDPGPSTETRSHSGTDEKIAAMAALRLVPDDLASGIDRASNKEGFTAEVRRVDEGLREVRADPKKVTLEIHDLDPLATEEEVKVEIRKGLWNGADEPGGIGKGLEPKPKGTESRRSGASKGRSH